MTDMNGLSAVGMDGLDDELLVSYLLNNNDLNVAPLMVPDFTPQEAILMSELGYVPSPPKSEAPSPPTDSVSPIPTPSLHPYDPSSAEDKNRKRAEQNRSASRSYRQRKKAYIQEVETKAAQLAKENDALKRELYRYKELTHKLSTEVDILRRHMQQAPVPISPPAAVVPDTTAEKENLTSQHQQLLQNLEHNVLNNADPGTLSENLKELHKTCRKRLMLSDKEIETWVDPTLQVKLAHISLDSAVAPAAQDQNDDDDDRKFWEEIASELKMTPEQREKFLKLRTDYRNSVQHLLEERGQINADIKTLFKNKQLYIYRLKLFSGKAQGDDAAVSNALKVSAKLDQLKRNLKAENAITDHVLTQFHALLTPLQEALLVLKTQHHNVSSMTLLKSIWDTITGPQC